MKYILCALLLFFTASVSAQSDQCQAAQNPGNGPSINILPTDSTVVPWTNETPTSLRSREVVDGVRAMRAKLSNWAPIAFDDNQQVSPADFDYLQFRIRSSVDRPPINVIAASGVVCNLNDFVGLSRNTWTNVAIPLKSLGLHAQSSIGRLKLKSAVKDAYTLWITQVKLVKSDGSSQPTPPPDDPVDDPDPADPLPVPDAQLDNLVNWHLDPGVSGEISDHLPTRSVTLNANGQDLLDDTASFTAALASIASGGIVNIPAGTYYVSNTINLNRDGQVLRGAGSNNTRIIFTQSLPIGIAITGGYPQSSTPVISGRYNDTALIIEQNNEAQPGKYALLSDSGSNYSQVVHIQSRSGSADRVRLQLTEPLNSHFGPDSFIQLFDANEYSGVESLSVDVASNSVLVGDMFHFRSAAHSWVRDVVSQRARGAHVFTRQTYHCEVTASRFVNATGHGDGKQGYGVDLANSTTGCLIENNRLALLRHSIVLNKAASGNVVAHNYSSSPRHTNFAEGGPGDISFHHFAYGNLVEGNIVERIHIGDASEVGAGNLIYQNCITSGPLTIDNSPGARQFLVENAMYGSDRQLQNTIMPPVLPETPRARPYLQPGNSLFDENGLSISANAAPPYALNNWYQSRGWNPSQRIATSFYGSRFNRLISGSISGNWQRDCRIATPVQRQ